jgi:hypothetical protein
MLDSQRSRARRLDAGPGEAMSRTAVVRAMDRDHDGVRDVGHLRLRGAVDADHIAPSGRAAPGRQRRLLPQPGGGAKALFPDSGAE